MPPDEKSVSEEVGSGLRSILERIGEFFHIFDLSFFVAGVMTFAALAFLYIMMKMPHEFPFAPWVGVVAFVVGSYVCGLIAFTVGRELNGVAFRRRILQRILPQAMAAHNLTGKNIAPYMNAEQSRFWWLYIRMWSEIAHEKSAPLVLHHLMRYWAMAATYDGIGFGFLVWATALVAVQFEYVSPNPISHSIGTTGALLCICASYFSFRRGADYYEYQIEDVVAHFAVAQGSLISNTE